MAWCHRDDGEHQIRPRPVDGPVLGARDYMDVALRMNGEYLAIKFHRHSTGQNLKERVRTRRVRPLFNVFWGGHALLNDARLFRLHKEPIITAIAQDIMLGCIGVDHGHSHSHSTVLCGDMDMCIALRSAIVKNEKL